MILHMAGNTVVREASRLASRDVLSPKCVRDGTVTKSEQQLNHEKLLGDLCEKAGLDRRFSYRRACAAGIKYMEQLVSTNTTRRVQVPYIAREGSTVDGCEQCAQMLCLSDNFCPKCGAKIIAGN